MNQIVVSDYEILNQINPALMVSSKDATSSNKSALVRSQGVGGFESFEEKVVQQPKVHPI